MKAAARLEHSVLGICASIAVLAGCGGSQPPIAAPREARSSALQARSADASAIYVTDFGSNKLTAYDLNGKLTLSITAGMDAPFGAAVDKNGKIYVANSFPNTGGDVTTYTPDGEQTIPTITDG